jgi:ankyrin repeat protein
VAPAVGAQRLAAMVDSTGGTALHAAALGGHVEVINLLLSLALPEEEVDNAAGRCGSLRGKIER